MASNRHLGRIIALQTLYEQDFRHDAGDEHIDLDDILSRNMQRFQRAIGDKAFVAELVHGVVDAIPELDALLGPLAPDWPVDQIARMDRTVLRMGIYELRRCDVPGRVAINEYVELAKSFGNENSSRFVNGVLGTYYRQTVEDAGGVDPRDGHSTVTAAPARAAAKDGAA